MVLLLLKTQECSVTGMLSTVAKNCLIEFSIVRDKIVPHFQYWFCKRHVCKICYTQWIWLHLTWVKKQQDNDSGSNYVSKHCHDPPSPTAWPHYPRRVGTSMFAQFRGRTPFVPPSKYAPGRHSNDVQATVCGHSTRRKTMHVIGLTGQRALLTRNDNY